MKNPQILDIYSDYLLSSFCLVTATGLSQLLDNGYSHYQISRFLAQEKFTSRDFWKMVKVLIRKIENDNAVLIIEDTIEEKPYSTENDIICWHWVHSKSINVKGINLLNFLYCVQNDDGSEINLPVGFDIIEKTEKYFDAKTKEIKRRSPVTKNQLVQEKLRTLVQLNRLKFRYILWDTWYSSKENLEFVAIQLKKYFVVALKSNRTIALSLKDKLEGKFVKSDRFL